MCHQRARRQKLMIENFSNFAKDINLQIQEVKETQTRETTKFISRHFILQLVKLKKKKTSMQWEWHFIYGEKINSKWQWISLQKSWELGKKMAQSFFSCWRKRPINSLSCIPQKHAQEWRGNHNILRKGKNKRFVTSRWTYKEWLKKVL